MVRFNRLVGMTLVCGAMMVPLLGVPTAQAADILPCNTSRPYRDLNGDGFEDAVVGDPYATVDGPPRRARSPCCSARTICRSVRATG